MNKPKTTHDHASEQPENVDVGHAHGGQYRFVDPDDFSSTGPTNPVKDPTPPL